MADTSITHDEWMNDLETIGKAVSTFQATMGAFAETDQLSPSATTILH